MSERIDKKVTVPAGQTALVSVDGISPLTVELNVNGGTATIDWTAGSQGDIEAGTAVFTALATGAAADAHYALTVPARFVRIAAVTQPCNVTIYGRM